MTVGLKTMAHLEGAPGNWGNEAGRQCQNLSQVCGACSEGGWPWANHLFGGVEPMASGMLNKYSATELYHRVSFVLVGIRGVPSLEKEALGLSS